MTDFQFQLLIGTILGSMLMIILAVVIAARVLYLNNQETKKSLFAEIVDGEERSQKLILKMNDFIVKNIDETKKSEESFKKEIGRIYKYLDLFKKELGFVTKYHVYWGHDIGGSAHYDGKYDTWKEAMAKVDELTDSMYSGWIEEREEKA